MEKISEVTVSGKKKTVNENKVFADKHNAIDAMVEQGEMYKKSQLVKRIRYGDGCPSFNYEYAIVSPDEVLDITNKCWIAKYDARLNQLTMF